MIILFILFNKLVKKCSCECNVSVGARRSCDKQQQLMTTWLIAMDCDGCIWCCYHQEAPKRSQHKHLECNEGGHGSKQRLEATRQPCQQMQQEHCKSVVSITTILILWWQLLSQECQTLQRKRDKCKKMTLYARNIRQIRQIHAPDLPTLGSTTKHTKRNSQVKKTKNKAVVTRTPRVTHDDCWMSRESSCLAEPVTPSLVTTD